MPSVESQEVIRDHRAVRDRLVDARRAARLVQRVGLAASVIRCVQKVGKVARTLGERGHGVHLRLPEDNPVGFRVTEKEELVFDQRTAEGRAELVLPVLRLYILEKVPVIQDVIPEVLPQVAVEPVGSGFGGDIQHRAR